ncbi:DUF4148 domain-containing protein [Pseudorhodoferax sp. Leaf267]|uniref:DUF4148 domain-containing protein n=1 Tax=Pseudorhodoferax sp. Leaf267 TaxID=1736316 RepID=UPI0006FCD229|nr:DUF4148 domain-containing protein [Pseudorhodoferax sp. Leaf267]KQP12144.1 hypothetical protein ASF43_21750 [Pseudorhodoferax sp. Leaf267]
MNTKLLLSALVAAAGFAAAPSFADNISGEVGYVPPAPVASKSGVTRADVHNAYVQAQRSGQLAQRGEGADIGYAAVASTRSRQDVHNEVVQAARNQQLAPRGEGADIGYVATPGVLTREAVHAEALRAQRPGRSGGV